MEDWINRQELHSLGEWFFNECVAGFFQLIYKEKNDFTVFLTHFLR